MSEVSEHFEQLARALLTIHLKPYDHETATEPPLEWQVLMLQITEGGPEGLSLALLHLEAVAALAIEALAAERGDTVEETWQRIAAEIVAEDCE